jgi:hypothetical protein
MAWPTNYTDEDTIFDLAGELIILTIPTGSGISATATSVTFNETGEVSNLNVPTYLTFDTVDTGGNFEIVKVTATATGGVCTIERAQNGSTALAHPAGATAVQDPIAYHFSQLRSLLLGIERYHGLVGLESALPATCVAGETYIATDTDAVFVAVATNTWREINELDHSQLSASSLQDDDHDTGVNAYHTATRKDTWHGLLTGGHITKAAHNHDGTADDGQPVARWASGLFSARPATPVNGQVYYATDTGDLWIGNSTTWVKYSVMPSEVIVIFEGDCPSGWTRVSGMDDRIPRGAAATATAGGDTGGSSTHVHTMPDVVNHTHTIQTQTGESLDSGGGHSHSKNNHSSGSGSNTRSYTTLSTGLTQIWMGHSNHSHSVTFPQHDTDDAGSNPANSDTESSWPPYRQLVFCEKD